MNSNLKYIVTTSRNANSTIRSQARQKANEWGVRYIDRHHISLADTSGDAEAAFVLDHDGFSLSTNKSQLRFTLGTAALRLQSIARGDPDTLVRAGELRAGDQVLDATLGLGRDALVAARAVGSTGGVVGIESSWPLFTLVSEGLASHIPGDESAIIQPLFADSRTFLAEAEKSSFDVVVIDPMFAAAKRSDGSFKALRGFADHASLDSDWIRSARRVARRWVVVKTDHAEIWFGPEKLKGIHNGGRASWFRAPPSY